MIKRIIDGHAHIKPASLLNDENKRCGIVVKKFGRVESLEGELLFRTMPEYMESSCFSAEALLQVLDQNCVEKVMLMQSLCMKRNEETAQAVLKAPDRIHGAMLIEPKDESCLEEIEYWNQRGLTALKFEMNPRLGYPYIYPDLHFDSPLFHKIWDKAEEKNLTVVIDPNRVGTPGYQPEAIKNAAQSHAGVRFVICHMGFASLDYLGDPEKMAEWRKMRDLAVIDNVWLDLAAMPDLFQKEGHPYPTALTFLKETKEICGSKKLIWGTDIPGTYKSATYKQMIRMYEESDVFSEQEKEDFFYNNANDVYFV